MYFIFTYQIVCKYKNDIWPIGSTADYQHEGTHQVDTEQSANRHAELSC